MRKLLENCLSFAYMFVMIVVIFERFIFDKVV